MRLASLLPLVFVLAASTARAQPRERDGLPAPPPRASTAVTSEAAVGERRAPGDGGGLLSLPRAPELYLPIDAVLARAGRDGLARALAPALWPEGAAPRSGSTTIFVQGLNTPRADGDELGGDARIREYLARGYLGGPVAVLHNATALEGRAASQSTGFDDAIGLLPVNQRDMVRSALMRLFGIGAGGLGSPVSREVDSVRRVVLAALDRTPPEDLHLVGYSDGSLLVERGLALAARDLARTRSTKAVEELLRAHVFVEYWGNATNLLVAGPRRLLVHDRRDSVTTRPVAIGGPGVLTTTGTVRATDVPSTMAADTVVVTFETPYTDMNNHNALAAIGPSLDAMKRREGASSSLALYDVLRGRGERGHHYAPSDLGVDLGAFSRFLWGRHGGRSEGLVRALGRDGQPVAGRQP